MVADIRRRQSAFFKHVMRKVKLEYVYTTGNLLGKRTVRRLREDCGQTRRPTLHGIGYKKSSFTAPRLLIIIIVNKYRRLMTDAMTNGTRRGL